MNLTDEINRLHTLHAQGALTDDEFAQAKAVLLAQLSPVSHSPDSEQLRQQLTDLREQNELYQLDHAWEQERQTYMVRARGGSWHIPSEATSLITLVVGVSFGLFWTILAVVMSSLIDLPLFGILFPAFGILFILGFTASGINSLKKARAYKEAEQRYQQRRAQLVSKHSAST